MARPATVPGIELGLDFSNTVDWRNGDKREDNLKTYESLVGWSAKEGIISLDEAPSILRKAKEEHMEDVSLKRAIQLRETIYRIFSSVAHGRHPDDRDLTTLNKFLSDYPVSSSIVRTGQEYSWVMAPGGGAEARMLWPIAKSAADLLTSDQLTRITECANEEDGCGWVFLDKTRSGTKKWCSSTGCGNRAKVRAWYDRHERA
ncbi:MAG: ABATE domain-containing protein [Nitrososphaerota archaeon]|nr:ABATE domain-containing protein [Nitrososphaerota archaeon]MDG7024818.1 ABATE domain-containing protein [Nitrososphaerota archaeon]